LKAGATGTGAAFDFSSGSLLGSQPATKSFTYEIDVTQMGLNTSSLGVTNAAWWNNGSAGISVATTGSGWIDTSRAPQPGDVLGVVYSDASRTTRIYLNGALVGVVPATDGSDTTARLPLLLSNGGRVAGAFRTSLSSYAANYVMDTAPTTLTAVQGQPTNLDPRVALKDAQGNPWTITAVGTPAHGVVSIAPGGASVIYTPAADYTGADTFTYSLSNGQGVTKTATATVKVSGANGFYAPTVSAGIGFYDLSADHQTFDLRDNGFLRGLLGSAPPTKSFSYELDVQQAAPGSALIGVADLTGPSYLNGSNWTSTTSGSSVAGPADSNSVW
jgi:hypothetical protein